MHAKYKDRGFAYVNASPATPVDEKTRTVDVTFEIQKGELVTFDRINVRGNTRTRDYVIRREFDIAEGDAYNRVLVDRAERRLKNLNYFKTVKITNEPGTSPDRIVINVEVEEQVSELVVAALRDGRADIGAFVEGPDTQGLDVRDFRRDELVLVLPRTGSSSTSSAVRRGCSALRTVTVP